MAPGCAYFKFSSVSSPDISLESTAADLNQCLQCVTSVLNYVSYEQNISRSIQPPNKQYRIINNGVPNDVSDRLLFLKARCEMIKNISKLIKCLNGTRFEKKVSELFNSTSYEPEMVFFEDSFNIAACQNSKVASRNLQRLFYVIGGHVIDNNPDHLSYHPAVRYYRKHLMNQSTAQTVRTSYINIMFVREPMERLVSAFRAKSGQPWDAGKRAENYDLPFKDYLLMVLSGAASDSHSRTFYKQCGVCNFPYNIIGTIDTFDRDVTILLEQIGETGRVNLPTREGTGYESTNSSSVTAEYFREVPNDVIHKLWEHFIVDYFLFGFVYPKHLIHVS